MTELMTRHAVDFPAPCSPLATTIGKGEARTHRGDQKGSN